MSLYKKRISDYYEPKLRDRDYITDKRVLTPIDPYYPQDYNGWPTDALEGSAKYSSWKDFKQRRPFNAQLLVHLFGERDAIDTHRSMCVISETKAATLCSFFSSVPRGSNRVRIVSDS